MKPCKYLVEYGQPDEEDQDPAKYRFVHGFARIKSARRFMKRQNAKKQAALLFERYDFVDVTPPGDPPGLLWEYSTRPVHPIKKLAKYVCPPEFREMEDYFRNFSCKKESS